MQFTLHATRRTPHGASRLVQAMSAWLVKTRRAPSRHSRDPRVYGHTTTAMNKLSTPPHTAHTPLPRRPTQPPPPLPRHPHRAGDLDLPERKKKYIYIYTSSREEDVDANICPCGPSIESRTHVIGECEMCKEERDVLVEMRKLDVCDKEEFGGLESSEKTIAILGDRWWPQTAKQDGDRISKHFLCNTWKKRNERPNVGGVSIRSSNGAPSRKGCVVNGQMIKASNK